MSLFQQFNIYPTLTPVRLVATSNQTGTYSNGPLNNGVGATFIYATGALTIDSVVVNVGDRILLQGQSSANQNGVYVCTQAGATGIAAILQRSADQQCIEQIHTGFTVTVAAGTLNGGATYVLVEPKPAILGISSLTFSASTLGGSFGTAAAKAASDNTQPDVASVSGATVVGNYATFADTSGTVTDSGHSIKSVHAAAAAGGAAAQSFTDAFCTSTSVVIGNWVTQANPEEVVTIVPGSGSFVVTSTGDVGAGTFSYVIIK